MREFELKARVEAPTALRRRLREAGWRRTFRGEMRDRRYDTPDRRLEAEDRVLRIRRYSPTEGDGRAVLAWKGPASAERGFRLREELASEVGDPDAAAAVLARLGYPEVTLAIDRRIEVWEKEGVVVRIEEYPRMDVLAEIEGDPAAVEARIGELGLAREAWRPQGLPAFVERYERRTGRKARLARREAPAPGDGDRERLRGEGGR